MPLSIACGALGAVNLAAFALCGWDKLCAKRGRRRVPERVLLGWGAAFGSAGLLAGMALFHHKTRKPKFLYGAPALLAAQVALVWVAARWLWPALAAA